MTLDILSYRLWRLRRLIAVAVLPPLAATALGLPASSPAFGLFICLSIIGPVAHILAYPKDWSETMTVSVVLAITLYLAAGIDPSAGVILAAFRVAGLAVLALVLFIVLLLPMGTILAMGPFREASQVRATGTSRLAPAELKAGITLYPGRDDARTTCGTADPDGFFDVEIRHEFAGIGGCAAGADGDEDSVFDEDGNMRVRFHASVVSTAEDHHEIITFEEPGGPVEAARHVFEATPKGTRVTVEETTAGLTGGMALGFWLQDYLADHLTDEIDAAEGRAAPRANRAFAQTSLLGDLVAWLGKRLRRDGDPQTDRG